MRAALWVIPTGSSAGALLFPLGFAPKELGAFWIIRSYDITMTGPARSQVPSRGDANEKVYIKPESLEQGSIRVDSISPLRPLVRQDGHWFTHIPVAEYACQAHRQRLCPHKCMICLAYILHSDGHHTNSMDMAHLFWANGTGTGTDDVKPTAKDAKADIADMIMSGILTAVERKVEKTLPQAIDRAMEFKMPRRAKPSPPIVPKAPAKAPAKATPKAKRMTASDKGQKSSFVISKGAGITSTIVKREGNRTTIRMDLGDVTLPAGDFETSGYYVVPTPDYPSFYEFCRESSRWRCFGVSVTYDPAMRTAADSIYGGKVIITPVYGVDLPDFGTATQALCGLSTSGSVNDRVTYTFQGDRLSRDELDVPTGAFNISTDNTPCGFVFSLQKPSGTAAAEGAYIGRLFLTVTFVVYDQICPRDKCGSYTMYATGGDGTNVLGTTMKGQTTRGYLFGTRATLSSRRIDFGYGLNVGDVIVMEITWRGTSVTTSYVTSNITIAGLDPVAYFMEAAGTYSTSVFACVSVTSTTASLRLAYEVTALAPYIVLPTGTVPSASGVTVTVHLVGDSQNWSSDGLIYSTHALRSVTKPGPRIDQVKLQSGVQLSSLSKKPTGMRVRAWAQRCADHLARPPFPTPPEPRPQPPDPDPEPDPDPPADGASGQVVYPTLADQDVDEVLYGESVLNALTDAQLEAVLATRRNK